MLNSILLSGHTMIYLSIHTYLRTSWLLQVFAIVNKAAIKQSCAEFCMDITFLTLRGKCQGIWLLDYMLKVYLISQETIQLSPKVSVPFAFSPAVNEIHYSLFLVPLFTICIPLHPCQLLILSLFWAFVILIGM